MSSDCSNVPSLYFYFILKSERNEIAKELRDDIKSMCGEIGIILLSEIENEIKSEKLYTP